MAWYLQWLVDTSVKVQEVVCVAGGKGEMLANVIMLHKMIDWDKGVKDKGDHLGLLGTLESVYSN